MPVIHPWSAIVLINRSPDVFLENLQNSNPITGFLYGLQGQDHAWNIISGLRIYLDLLNGVKPQVGATLCVFRIEYLG